MKKREPSQGEVYGEGDVRPAAALPGINFSTFVLSLNSSALVHLGVISAPGTSITEINLDLAKQTIDILGMLEEKTAGNLTEDEIKFLSNMLHDLRLMYVKCKEQEV